MQRPAPEVLLLPAEAEMFASLQRDGILRVEDFGLGDAELDKLQAIAANAMEGEIDPTVTSVYVLLKLMNLI